MAFNRMAEMGFLRKLRGTADRFEVRRSFCWEGGFLRH
jgi:hypothetical protein